MSKKKLCKLVDDDILKDKPEKYKEMVSKPKYLCKKCGRVAADEKQVCKPEKL